MLKDYGMTKGRWIYDGWGLVDEDGRYCGRFCFFRKDAVVWRDRMNEAWKPIGKFRVVRVRRTERLLT